MLSRRVPELAATSERREIESGMQEAALASLEHVDPRDNATLTLFNPDWHQGVIGIVASRLKEKFYRPTITFAPAGDGTDVTESFRLNQSPLLRVFWMFAGYLRGRRNVRDMRTTLERIKKVVETGG